MGLSERHLGSKTEDEKTYCSRGVKRTLTSIFSQNTDLFEKLVRIHVKGSSAILSNLNIC